MSATDGSPSALVAFAEVHCALISALTSQDVLVEMVKPIGPIHLMSTNVATIPLIEVVSVSCESVLSVP